ncbi:hypothetical protein L249_7265 [Ophiocordyceps polyrhachis-furcata BCC 54312]|uniref:Uncharacterized protein n=1 Tax=Ophiocordyceps polyrhachis-furcata BCC 54312 TaxID=1330021 RepID=A0A367LBF1_9HYPO|nr:hypothetical protein L249_7265 [Ophiocordyceps polyrhachis-furcata BCC 54312]
MHESSIRALIPGNKASSSPKSLLSGIGAGRNSQSFLAWELAPAKRSTLKWSDAIALEKASTTGMGVLR